LGLKDEIEGGKVGLPLDLVGKKGQALLYSLVQPDQRCGFIITLGSVISISPLYSMDCNGLDTDFAKPLSNDFNRLGGK
jgi:hypothetical protein